MRIHVKPSSRRPSRVTLNLVGMIDVVFLLLTYFLVTITLNTPEDRLRSGLHADRESASGPATDFQPQIVEVLIHNGQPAYQLGTRIFRDQASLEAALEPLNKDAGLFVRVRSEPQVGFVMGALQAGHDAGFNKVTYVVAN